MEDKSIGSSIFPVELIQLPVLEGVTMKCIVFLLPHSAVQYDYYEQLYILVDQKSFLEVIITMAFKLTNHVFKPPGKDDTCVEITWSRTRCAVSILSLVLVYCWFIGGILFIGEVEQQSDIVNLEAKDLTVYGFDWQLNPFGSRWTCMLCLSMELGHGLQCCQSGIISYEFV